MSSRAGTVTSLPPPPVLPSGRLALFLDLDGVLAPIADHPDAVGPDPRRTTVLKALDRRLEGRIAIISGRTLVEIDRIAERASLSAAGVHGLERRRLDGSIQRVEPAPAVLEALTAFHAFASERPGVLVEDKGVSAGLHYRQSRGSEAAALCLAQAIAEQTGLNLQRGHMVLELKTRGADKGSAVTAFMDEPLFAGSTPIMLGDDLTDEAGFRAVEASGGYGILVASDRDTAARYSLADVDAVLTWLEGVAQGSPT